MIHEIAPHRFDNEYKNESPNREDIALWYQGSEVFMQREKSSYVFPRFRDLNSNSIKTAQFAFSIDDINYFLILSDDMPEADNYFMVPIREMREHRPMYQAFAGVTGSQLNRFYKTRKFCGVCGKFMMPGIAERSMVCESCGHIEYPKVSPAIIVAIINENKLLMTKYAYGEYKKYALVAGFVEVGESFEETVVREVKEEVGLNVKNVQYYKSQPWGFSDSEMVGFFAELDGDDKITLQESELSEGVWFDFDEIPKQKNDISIGSELIEAVRSGEYKKYLKPCCAPTREPDVTQF